MGEQNNCIHFPSLLKLSGWIFQAPIVAIVATAFLLLICFRGSLRASWNSMGQVTATASGATPTQSVAPTRELTAAELAGGRTNSNNPTAAGTPAATQGRRSGRRNRRTPSQISTKSLPVYQKEPGDQELVIYRLVLISFYRCCRLTSCLS